MAVPVTPTTLPAASYRTRMLASENVTGWSIDGEGTGDKLVDMHAESAYQKLEQDILPTWRNDKEYWAEIMRSCIALNGAHFTTERMLREYIQRAYLD